MSSSQSESRISISSETILSLDQTTNSETAEVSQCKNNNEDRIIVISDTELEIDDLEKSDELEEGEIDDDEEESKPHKSDSVNSKTLLETVNHQWPEAKPLNLNLEDSASSKRKLTIDGSYEINKKSKFDIAGLGEFGEANELVNDFLWSELNVLMVGDERVITLNWEEWEDFPTQELFHLPFCTLSSLCAFIEKHLYKEYDVVLVFAFHYDFIQCEEPSSKEDNAHTNSVIKIREDVNLSDLIKTVQKYHYKWVRQYPNTNIIWTIPSPPDFLKFNSFVMKEQGIDPEEQLNRKQQHKMAKDYFELAQKLVIEWNLYLKYIPLFPLSKVLFIKKHCYKKTFLESGSPRFPRGFLKNGLYPTKMMALYCGYLLVEFLIDEGFYPENKIGLDLRKAETKLVEVNPDFKNYLHSFERSGNAQIKKHKYSRHHSSKHLKHSSESPHRSGSGCCSKRNRPCSSNHHHKSSSKSKDQRAKSDSRSISREKRKSHSKSKSKKSRFQRRSHSSSSSVSLSSLEEEKNINTMEAAVEKVRNSDESKSGFQIKDEVNFWKTLRYLREVHDIQCQKFRRKPHTHPQYIAEREKFLASFNHNSVGEIDLSKWNEYWIKRMEEIFEETWSVKKQQLTIDLSKKGSFKSLNALVEEEREKSSLKNKESENVSKGITNDRIQFRKENAETIKSYLDEFQSAIESLKSSSQERAQLIREQVENRDFTLADIFKDSPVKEIPPENPEEGKSMVSVINSCVMEHSPVFTTSTPDTPKLSLPCDFKSENNNKDSDSDIDLDGLMTNPDFLQGLDEIDKELNSVPLESKTKELTSNLPSSTPVNELSSLLPHDALNQICSEDVQIEFVNVLKMLFRVSKRLGPLGLSISALYLRASDDLKNKREKFSSLNAESKSLLTLVDKRLSILLKENLPQVQKAIYGEISERLQALLGKMNVEYDKFSKVNIHSIAVATLGQEIAGVVSFIKNTLLYHGYTQFSSDDVMNIYMSVKASQIDMGKS